MSIHDIEIEFPFSELPLTIGPRSAVFAPPASARATFACITGRATIRQSCVDPTDGEMVEVWIEAPGDAPVSAEDVELGRPAVTRDGDAAKLFAWIETCLFARHGDEIRAKIDDAANCDRSADAAREALV